MACGKIVPIDKGVVHKICSGQVILDIATAVKELVENALDAGATNIEVRLKEYGSELIEVADNGSGIAPSDYHALTQKYHTSKLQQFTDLQDLGTFGFRGEALSSLCALAELSVVTRQEGQDAGVKLDFDQAGNLKETGSAARSTGTTICIRDIFKPLPVRYKEFKRNLKREYAKMVIVLQAYALISTGVRIICTNQVGNGGRSNVVSTQSSQSVRGNIVTVFGSRAVEGLESFEAPAGGSSRFTGFVSKGNAGTSRSTGDRQFLYLNGRPVDMPKVSKVVNETFRSLTSPALAHHKPMFIINIIAPRDGYDVNVTPDKRKVFMENEKALIEALQQGLSEVWEPTRSTYQVHNATPVSQQDTAELRNKRKRSMREETADDSDEDEDDEEDAEEDSPGVKSTPLASQTPAPSQRNSRASMLSAFQQGSGYRSSPLGQASRSSTKGDPVAWSNRPQFGKTTPSQPLISRFVRTIQPASDSKPDRASTPPAVGGSEAEEDDREMEAQPAGSPASLPDEADEAAPSPVSEGGQAAADGGSQDRQQADMEASPLSRGPPRQEDDPGEEPQDQGMEVEAAGGEADGSPDAVVLDEQPEQDAQEDRGNGPGMSVSVDLEQLRSQWRKKRRLGTGGVGAASLKAASIMEQEGEESPADSSAAEAELERIFCKSSFRDLRILGQFNLGFILARLSTDLFIIDQHASDEKFNFERLTRTTQMNRQPLLAPQPLDLTPSETIVIREQMHVFTQNGFEFKDAPDGDLLLTGIPYSKNTTFGKADVQELAQILLEGSVPVSKGVANTPGTPLNVSDNLPRPSRVRAMLAMRACRSSIMIGKTLDTATMRRILDNLAELKSPWNCPHGRPTMRHLAVLPQEKQ